MSNLVDKIIARAKANKQRIVLPEAEEERTLIAADKVLADDIADLILIGNPKKVAALAKEHNLTHLDKATLFAPETGDMREEFAHVVADLVKK
ncbi:MAG: phosphate acetyltransferase, partial [Bacteroidales bacterium]|nr:phosphate acetyltransferase [Candidatus Minthousia equi]